MRIAVTVSEEEFKSGKILDRIEPPVIQYRDSDGWTIRVELAELSKLTRFNGDNAEFLKLLQVVSDAVSE